MGQNRYRESQNLNRLEGTSKYKYFWKTPPRIPPSLSPGRGWSAIKCDQSSFFYYIDHCRSLPMFPIRIWHNISSCNKVVSGIWTKMSFSVDLGTWIKTCNWRFSSSAVRVKVPSYYITVAVRCRYISAANHCSITAFQVKVLSYYAAIALRCQYYLYWLHLCHESQQQ